MAFGTFTVSPATNSQV